MHILFVYVGLPLGGVETLLVRLSRSLARAGVRVSVLLATRRADPGLLAQLSDHARIAYLDQFIPAGPWRPILDKPLLRFVLPLDGPALRQWLKDVPDVCHAADTGSLLLAARLSAVAALGRLTVGVYHDREYLFEDEDVTFVRRAETLFRGLPPEHVVFFNESSVLVHTARFGIDYRAGLLTPIGIDAQGAGAVALGKRSRRVVSIGRLTPFKTYNSQMLEAIARLRSRGLELQYDIYGTGECESALREQIATLGLQQQVHLKGTIAYERIAEVLEGALAFVGSGTVLIEASAAGVPAIIGIEHAVDAGTYGFLHDTNGLSYHDAGLPYPLTSFDTCLETLSMATEAGYAEHTRRAQLRALDFSIERTSRDFIGLAQRTSHTTWRPQSITALESISLNASMLALRWRARRGQARFFDRHSNVAPS